MTNSAFASLPVRRLFITIEKAIATAAKYSMFEFNDDFTQAQFRNLVIPYLRDIQGRRGIKKFQVICDGTNNTETVVNAEQFVADMYVQPNRSASKIQLNFIAVDKAVTFTESVGAA
jgi:phage tail sheath protein FI